VDCKSTGIAFTGSNPVLPTIIPAEADKHSLGGAFGFWKPLVSGASINDEHVFFAGFRVDGAREASRRRRKTRNSGDKK
jgi:hypothetical protein